MSPSLVMHIRPALPQDLPEIAQLHEANWRRDYAGVLPEYALGAHLTDYMARKWHNGALRDRRCLVARDGAGTLLGFAAMLDSGPDEHAFLDNLHVAPAFRAHGIGRALMSSVAVLAIPGPLSLEVLCANMQARAIYKAWGGEESAEFADDILGVSVPAVTVTWRDTVWLADRLSGADV
ncbi:N-acetyltransferase family protein [Gymnodinialimonas hymeniacidonis]|uniref:GNAT family N-acetyltransferase n=1 Tax=Gymnodinialimonas hymeniacidonis TaxID=3126508 RepID=UPI0034C63D7A